MSVTTKVELHDYLEWLEKVWLPNLGKGLTYPERPVERPTLTLIRGGSDDAR